MTRYLCFVCACLWTSGMPRPNHLWLANFVHVDATAAGWTKQQWLYVVHSSGLECRVECRYCSSAQSSCPPYYGSRAFLAETNPSSMLEPHTTLSRTYVDYKQQRASENKYLFKCWVLISTCAIRQLVDSEALKGYRRTTPEAVSHTCAKDMIPLSHPALQAVSPQPWVIILPCWLRLE